MAVDSRGREPTKGLQVPELGYSGPYACTRLLAVTQSVFLLLIPLLQKSQWSLCWSQCQPPQLVHGNTKTGVLSVPSGHGVGTVALGASLVVTTWHVVFCEVMAVGLVLFLGLALGSPSRLELAT